MKFVYFLVLNTLSSCHWKSFSGSVIMNRMNAGKVAKLESMVSDYCTTLIDVASQMKLS